MSSHRGFRYYVAEFHHHNPVREFLNVGVLVLDLNSDERAYRTVEPDSAQGRLAWSKAVDGLPGDFVSDWMTQFRTMPAERIEAFRQRSYMSSLLLSEPLAVMAESAVEAIDCIWPNMCEASA